MNEELVNYISTNLARGVPKQEIEKALITSGWDIYSINQAFAKEVRISNDITSQTIPISPPPKGIMALIKTILPYLVVSILISIAYLFLDKDLYFNVITIPQLPELCRENIKGCNFPFAIISVTQIIAYLLTPGILILYAFRKKYGLAIGLLLAVSLLRLLFVFRFFAFFTSDVFFIPQYQRYLSPVLMFLVLFISYLFFRFIKIPESVKSFILSFEILIVAALLIVIPQLTPINQKIDIVLEVLNSKPLITPQLTEDLKAKRDYIEHTSEELRKADEDISPLAACTTDQIRHLFPDSLILDGNVYPKSSQDVVGGYLPPIAQTNRVIEYGNSDDKIQLSMIRSKDSQTFSTKMTIFEGFNPGKEKLFGEEVQFFIDRANKQWEIQALNPKHVILTFRPTLSADPKIQVSDLKGLIYDWFSKVCYTNSNSPMNPDTSIQNENTATLFAKANNTLRNIDVNFILNAVHQYAADNKGQLPAGIDTTVRTITDAGGATDVDLCAALVPAYIVDLPLDPVSGSRSPANLGCTDPGTDYDTKYTVVMTNDGKVTVSAPSAELDQKISVTR